MKHVVLSDFATEQLKQRAAEREERYASAVKEYEGRLKMRQDRIDSLREEGTQARREGKHLRVVICACAILLARLLKLREVRRRRPVRPEAGVIDEIWRYGHKGEERVLDCLSRHLDDSWTWLGGYHNPGGEIDGILVGNSGVYAFEIKSHKGIVEVDGDNWVRSRFDNYGNLVGFREPMADRGGRSPARQVNGAADRLEAFLSGTMKGCKILRGVVLADDSVTLASVKDPTVDAVILLHSWDLPAMFSKSAMRLTSGEVDRLVRQIVKDHGYWESRRRKNVPGSSGPARDLAPAA